MLRRRFGAAVAAMCTSTVLGLTLPATAAAESYKSEYKLSTVLWLMLAMLSGLALMIAFPQIALWLPGRLGYL